MDTVTTTVHSRLAVAPFLMLVASMTLTGVNVPIGKVIATEIPVLVFLSIRFAIATLALFALSSKAERRALARTWRPSAIQILVLAGIGSVMFTVFLLEGTKRTSASDAGIITATMPAVVAVLSVVFLKARIGRAAIACIALSVAGLVVMQMAAARPDTSGSLFGNTLVAAAVVSEAIFVLMSRTTARNFSPVSLSLAVCIASLALSLPFTLATLAQGPWPSISAGTWALAVWYALASSVIFTILWYRGAAEAPTWQAGLATTALPIAALAVAVLALGEKLGTAQLIGAALVISAIVAGALMPTGSPDAAVEPDPDKTMASASDLPGGAMRGKAEP